MQVSNANNIKLYNLTSGKSVPEWLSDRKRRALLKKDVELSRRIELIQDLEMPCVSSYISMSPDLNYIMVCGTYKPVFRCYDVHQMSMKYEQCFDTEAIKFVCLEKDYRKILFLQHDRFLEFHKDGCRYFRLRVPKHNRDVVVDESTCEVFIASSGPEVYRLSLQRGSFLNSYKTSASAVNCAKLNSKYHLLFFGTQEGTVEAWDPRERRQAAVLDCARPLVEFDGRIHQTPFVTSMALDDNLRLAVGTSSGQCLLFDIRARKPLLIKDHNSSLPIKDVRFGDKNRLMFTLDKKALKIFNSDTAQPYTAILSPKPLNNMCIVPDTGLIMMSNEAPKVQVHYIPSIGPAPKWCSFLDSITEELEESSVCTVYDNYKFLTRDEINQLGLSHLIGTNLLRGYMHGFFIDVRFYTKAVSERFNFKDYKKKVIEGKIRSATESVVNEGSLPTINRNLARKWLSSAPSKSKEVDRLVLQDKRFQQMFTDPNFAVNEDSDTYRLLAPVLNSQTASKNISSSCDAVDNEEASLSDCDSISSEENAYTTERRRAARERKRLAQQQRPVLIGGVTGGHWKEKRYTVLEGDSVEQLRSAQQVGSATLGERLSKQNSGPRQKSRGVGGNRQMSIVLSGKNKKGRH